MAKSTIYKVSTEAEKKAIKAKFKEWLLKNKKAILDRKLSRTEFGKVLYKTPDGWDERYASGVTGFLEGRKKNFSLASLSYKIARRERQKIPEKLIASMRNKEKYFLKNPKIGLPPGTTDAYIKHIKSGARIKDKIASALSKELGIDLHKEHMFSLALEGADDPIAQFSGSALKNMSQNKRDAFQKKVRQLSANLQELVGDVGTDQADIMDIPSNWEASSARFGATRRQSYLDLVKDGAELDLNNPKTLQQQISKQVAKARGYAASGAELTDSDKLILQSFPGKLGSKKHLALTDSVVANRQALEDLAKYGFIEDDEWSAVRKGIVGADESAVVKKAREVGDTLRKYTDLENVPTPKGKSPLYKLTKLARGEAENVNWKNIGIGTAKGIRNVNVAGRILGHAPKVMASPLVGGDQAYALGKYQTTGDTKYLKDLGIATGRDIATGTAFSALGKAGSKLAMKQGGKALLRQSLIRGGLGIGARGAIGAAVPVLGWGMLAYTAYDTANQYAKATTGQGLIGHAKDNIQNLLIKPRVDENQTLAKLQMQRLGSLY